MKKVEKIELKSYYQSESDIMDFLGIKEKYKKQYIGNFLIPNIIDRNSQEYMDSFGNTFIVEFIETKDGKVAKYKGDLIWA